MSIRVHDLMSHPVVTFSDSETLSLAEEVMSMARIRHLPVVDDENRLVGLVTHRDLLQASLSTLTALSQAEDKQFKRSLSVGEIMQTDVQSIGADALALDAARAMRANKFGCLPVCDEDMVIRGIITEADFLDLAIRLLENTPPSSHAAPQQ